MFQIQPGCGNAKGQRGRLLAGMTATTCWSGQQGTRLQSRVAQREREGGGGRRWKEGESGSQKKKD